MAQSTPLINDKIFTIQIVEKGTGVAIHQDVLITRDLQMKSSEKSLKAVFDNECQTALGKILKMPQAKELLLK